MIGGPRGLGQRVLGGFGFRVLVEGLEVLGGLGFTVLVEGLGFWWRV